MEKKNLNTYAWMTQYVVHSGEVFKSLQLSKTQEVALETLLSKKSKAVLSGTGMVLQGCGECPIAALRTGKYKNCTASGLCCSGEIARLVDVPLHKEIKAILTKPQYEKYRSATAIMTDYSKQARTLMKAGEKGAKELVALHALCSKKLKKSLQEPVKKTAKVAH